MNDRIREAAGLGLTRFGENKTQEIRQKAGPLADLGLQWVLIGHLQTNKAKEAARDAAEVQSLDRLELAEALQRRLDLQGRVIDALVQVKTSAEDSKSGLAPAELPTFLRAVARWGLARTWLSGMLLAVAAFSWTAGLGMGDGNAFLAVCALSGAALGTDLALPGAMLAGVVAAGGDAGRHEGAYFGWWNFATKLNLALAAGLALPLLGWWGYTPGTRSAEGLDHPGGDQLSSYSAAAWAAALGDVVSSAAASTVIAAGTPRGNEVLAHLAARLDVAMAANVVQVDTTEPLVVTRQVVGGAALEEMKLDGPVAIIYVAGHACEAMRRHVEEQVGGGESSTACVLARGAPVCPDDAVMVALRVRHSRG